MGKRKSIEKIPRKTKKQRKSLKYAITVEDFSRYISGKQEFNLEFISIQEGPDTDSHRKAIENAKVAIRDFTVERLVETPISTAEVEEIETKIHRLANAMTPDERTKKDIPLKMGETTMRLISILDCYCHSMSVEKIKDIFDKTRPSQKKVEWMHFAMNNPNASEVAEFLRDRFEEFNKWDHNKDKDIAHPFWFFLTGADPSRNEEALNKNEESILRIIISTDTSALTDTQHILENPDGKGFTACPLPEEHIAISRRKKTRVPGLFAAWIQWSNRERYKGLINLLKEIFYTNKEKLTTAIKKIVGDLEKNSLINLDKELNKSYREFIINLTQNGLLIGIDYLKINMAAQRCEDPTLIEEVKRNICYRGEKFKDLLIAWQNTEIADLRTKLNKIKTEIAASEGLARESNIAKEFIQNRLEELSDVHGIKLNNRTRWQQVAPGIRIRLLDGQYRLRFSSEDGTINFKEKVYTYQIRVQIFNHICLIKTILDVIKAILDETYRPEESFQALIPGVDVMITGVDYPADTPTDFLKVIDPDFNKFVDLNLVIVSFVLKYTMYDLKTGERKECRECRTTTLGNLNTLIKAMKEKFNDITNIQRLLPENVRLRDPNGDNADRLIEALRRNSKYLTEQTLPKWTFSKFCWSQPLLRKRGTIPRGVRHDPCLVFLSQTKKIEIVFYVNQYVKFFTEMNDDKELFRKLLKKNISCIGDPLASEAITAFLTGHTPVLKIYLHGIEITLTGLTATIDYKPIMNDDKMIFQFNKKNRLEVTSTVKYPNTKKTVPNNDMNPAQFTAFLEKVNYSFRPINLEFHCRKHFVRTQIFILTTSGLSIIPDTKKKFKVCGRGITTNEELTETPFDGFTLQKIKHAPKDNGVSYGPNRPLVINPMSQKEIYDIYLEHNGKRIKIATIVDGELEKKHRIIFSNKYHLFDTARLPLSSADEKATSSTEAQRTFKRTYSINISGSRQRFYQPNQTEAGEEAAGPSNRNKY